jgi:SAM-dependent methyltransferase
MTPAAHLPPTPRFVFDDGQAYESTMGRWSVLVAEPFLDWLGLPEGLAWLDDGCGNGSFTEVLLSRQRPLSVVGVDPSPAQLAFARQRAGTARGSFVEGDAQALPLPGGSVDVAVMALVLFFLPEPEQGLRELVRVVRTGGTIAAYHWDIAGGGFPLEPIVAAVHAEGYQTHRPPSTWAASLEASENLWRRAGLVDVQTCQIRVRRGFDSFEDFWRTAYGSPRLRDLFDSISPAALQRLRDRVCDGLNAAQGAPLVVEARANAVKGRRP